MESTPMNEPITTNKATSDLYNNQAIEVHRLKPGFGLLQLVELSLKSRGAEAWFSTAVSSNLNHNADRKLSVVSGPRNQSKLLGV
jgi:hypothetical protein